MEKAIDTADNETLSLNDLSPVSEIGYVHIHYENLPIEYSEILQSYKN